MATKQSSDASGGRRIYRVITPTVHYGPKGRETFTPGSEVYDEDHPAVRANPAIFEEVTVLGVPTGRVEQATAAPAEKRNAAPPKEKEPAAREKATDAKDKASTGEKPAPEAAEAKGAEQPADTAKAAEGETPEGAQAGDATTTSV